MAPHGLPFQPPVSSPTAAPEVQPILEAVGEQLRQARVEQGLSLADLAQRLKMGQEQLAALEGGDASRLPEPVFVIAQIRRVAAVLGVNADASIQALRQNGALQPASAAPSPVLDAPPRSRPGGRFPWRPLLLALVLLPGMGWLAVRGWPQLQLRPQPAAPIAKPLPRQAPATPPAAQPQAAASLTLSSQKPSWLAVRDSKGRSLFEGTFSGQRSFPLGQGLEVLAGRPDLVQARLGDGKVQALGPIEAVRWRRFTPPTP